MGNFNLLELKAKIFQKETRLEAVVFKGFANN